MSKDPLIEQTRDALQFLRQLDHDPALASRCEKTDLEGRCAIAAQLGLPISPLQLRRAIRSWDFDGHWHRWQKNGCIAIDPTALPLLTDPHPLTHQHIEKFRQDGFVQLEQIASAEELLAYRPVIRDLIERYNTANPGETAEERCYLQILNMHLLSEAAAQLTRNQRFGKMAAELMGVDAVRLYVDQGLYKEPGGKITHWHQDGIYFPVSNIITLWLPLTDISLDMGPVAYAKGSHLDGYLNFKPDFDDAEQRLPDFLAERNYPIWAPDTMRLGDAIFHDKWTIHGAYPNLSDKNREVAVMIYYPDGTLIPEPENAIQETWIDIVFPGSKPGEPAASQYTPVVYSAK